MDQNQMMLEYLMEMGAMQPQQDAIAQKRALVDMLRQQGARPPGVSTTPGGGGGRGVYDQPQIQQAASPLANLAPVAQQGLATYQDQQANQMQDQYGAQRRAALAALQARMRPPGTDTGVGAAPY